MYYSKSCSKWEPQASTLSERESHQAGTHGVLQTWAYTFSMDFMRSSLYFLCRSSWSPFPQSSETQSLRGLMSRQEGPWRGLLKRRSCTRSWARHWWWIWTWQNLNWHDFQAHQFNGTEATRKSRQLCSVGREKSRFSWITLYAYIEQWNFSLLGPERLKPRAFSALAVEPLYKSDVPTSTKLSSPMFRDTYAIS